MIKALQDWAMILSGVAMFGSLCEVILPEGSFPKYIRLGLGMILVLALLSPVKGLLNQEWHPEESWEIAYTEKQIDDAEEKQRIEVRRIYQENLEKKMLLHLQSKIPEFSGSVQCQVEEGTEFGAIHQVVVSPDSEVEGDSVRRILSEEFGITEEQVHLRF